MLRMPARPLRSTGRALARRAAQVHRGPAGPDAGFSLLEVVVSFVIFAIVAASAMAAMTSATKASHKSQQRVDAANVAQFYVAQAQNNTAGVRSETNKQYSAGVENEAFTVLRSVTFPARATQCSPGVQFTVSVLVYQAQAYARSTGSGFLARSDSVITC